MPGQRTKQPRLALSLTHAEARDLRAYAAGIERTTSWVIRRLLRDAGITAAPGGKASSQKTPGAAL